MHTASIISIVWEHKSLFLKSVLKYTVEKQEYFNTKHRSSEETFTEQLNSDFPWRAEAALYSMELVSALMKLIFSNQHSKQLKF